MTHRVVYSRRAQEQLGELYAWIAERSGYPVRAERFVSAILDHCDSLAEFPFVGAARDDLRPGLRTLGFRRRVVIAFAVTESTVAILGIYYGGQDHDARIRDDST